MVLTTSIKKELRDQSLPNREERGPSQYVLNDADLPPLVRKQTTALRPPFSYTRGALNNPPLFRKQTTALRPPPFTYTSVTRGAPNNPPKFLLTFTFNFFDRSCYFLIQMKDSIGYVSQKT
jgi:hypothetical protein